MLNNRLAVRLLNEYGCAISGNCSDVDGGIVESNLADIANMIDDHEEYDLDNMRKSLNLCPKGNGHWRQHCDDDRESR